MASADVELQQRAADPGAVAEPAEAIGMSSTEESEEVEDNHDHSTGSSEEVKPGDKAGREEEPSWTSWAGLFLGPTLALVLGLVLSLAGPSSMLLSARRLVGVTAWMAVWWMTEAVPLGITSLLPLVMFPVLGILDQSVVATCYSSSISWLFFGGFQLAFAVERTGLHRRLAFGVLRCVGTRPPCMMLGVMLSVAVLSMFLSNTSTTLMILPVAEAMTVSLGDGEASEQLQLFGKALMLGLAYAASMGGLGTLIGTPPNGVLAAQAEKFDLNITFSRWMLFAAPLAIIMVVFTWLYLVVFFRVPRAGFGTGHPSQKPPHSELGRMSQAERRVAVVFALTVLAWMFRKPVVSALHLPEGRLEDCTISIAATILLFIVPARDGMGRSSWLMDWQTLLKTPWHILFLFGGGFALAKAFQETLLSAWIGARLSMLQDLPTMLTTFLIVLVVTFLTEVTSNTATANVLLPIIGQLALTLGVRPVTLMVPATMAASCAFMLPVATPPNAIVFATKRIRMKDMAQTGLLLNFATAAIITVWMFTWGTLWFDLSSLAADRAAAGLPSNTTQPQPNIVHP